MGEWEDGGGVGSRESGWKGVGWGEQGGGGVGVGGMPAREKSQLPQLCCMQVWYQHAAGAIHTNISGPTHPAPPSPTSHPSHMLSTKSADLLQNSNNVISEFADENIKNVSKSLR